MRQMRPFGTLPAVDPYHSQTRTTHWRSPTTGSILAADCSCSVGIIASKYPASPLLASVRAIPTQPWGDPPGADARWRWCGGGVGGGEGKAACFRDGEKGPPRASASCLYFLFLRVLAGSFWVCA